MTDVQKLEELLSRIQRNRGSARAAPVAAAAAPPAVSRAPAKPTPLERAVSDRLVTPAAPSTRPEPARPAPVEPPAPAPERPVARVEPLAERAPASVPVSPAAPAAPMPPEPERELIMASATAAPSGPIARTSGRVEPERPATFGVLLERTLALRPR